MCGDSQPGGHMQASPDSLPRSQPSQWLVQTSCPYLAGPAKAIPLPVPEHFALWGKKAKAAHLLGVCLAVVHRRRQLRERLELAAWVIQIVKQHRF